MVQACMIVLRVAPTEVVTQLSHTPKWQICLVMQHWALSGIRARVQPQPLLCLSRSLFLVRAAVCAQVVIISPSVIQSPTTYKYAEILPSTLYILLFMSPKFMYGTFIVAPLCLL